ncbi:Crooked neck-like protein 1 [Amphibalanus amphitrite]|uniref:Crooked neck-like protein 1 n=1 Tax=Amphibalanus amphitrite TaxID=1232801 RepID=A0A6A4VKN4_AMPAM|nr:Crooked neck-like protein 1 [Amphibalanus amphitrite]KAF0291870.1 Crooked neck-like protein 1 [Amphibalanus amphitrite]
MESPAPGKPQKPPKVAKVKNKAPAEVQITAEQLLREAKERELEIVARPPKQKINDPEELAEYRMKKRKQFEDNIRKNRGLIANWLKYAQWEESQKEIQRARSVFERALDVDHRNITLWLRYAETEMRNKQINHARNLWDRAVTVLPRANQFWYKYTYMEEMLGNVAGCRAVFERWMEWEPEEQAWQTYVKFELRYKELDRARHIYERFVMVHPDVKNWIKFAKFEERYNYIASARRIYERAIEFFGEENMFEELFIAFARFEENQKEHDRVRVIYKYALDHIPKEQCQELYKQYTIHEKKYGDRKGIEDVIVSKRKHQYETELEANPSNYDAWFDLLRLVESEGDVETIRETYERAIANVPPTREKRFWRRYIYLWINYAVYEELEARDMERARQVYRAALELTPHKHFTFAKLWLMYAHFEIRQKDLTAARRAMGAAIGRCAKDKLFRGYIELEIQLREFDRCRLLYEKFLEFGPQNCTTWIKVGPVLQPRPHLLLQEGPGRVECGESGEALALLSGQLLRAQRQWREVGFGEQGVRASQADAAGDEASTLVLFGLQSLPDGRRCMCANYGGAVVEQCSHVADQLQRGPAGQVTALAADIWECLHTLSERGTTVTFQWVPGHAGLDGNEHADQLAGEAAAAEQPDVQIDFVSARSAIGRRVGTMFAELETLLGDAERARAIYELAINQPRLDMPEILWKSYIDFETEQEEFDRTRQLYERLLQRTQHVKVWMSFAQFELRLAADGGAAQARAVYQRASGALRQSEEKEERLMLLEAWKNFEEEHGSEETLLQVQKMMPKRVKRRRKIVTDDGEETGWEEYFDYIFPEDEAARPNLKLLQMAKLWRKQQEDGDAPATETGPGETQTETETGGPGEEAEGSSPAGEGAGRSSPAGEEAGGTPPGTPPPPPGAELPEDIDRDDSGSSSDSSSESEEGPGT